MRRSQLQCTIHPFGSLPALKYVVVCARYQGQWLLSRHKSRNTWETQGGHIEPGETPLQAARRELFEESGVTDAALYPVCDYRGFTETTSANGTVFLADVRSIGSLPSSEMEAAELFAELPGNLTYPLVSPRLYEKAAGLLKELELE